MTICFTNFVCSVHFSCVVDFIPWDYLKIPAISRNSPTTPKITENPWKSLKNPYRSPKTSKFPFIRKSRKSPEIPRNSQIFPDIPRTLQKFPRTLPKSLESYQNPLYRAKIPGTLPKSITIWKISYRSGSYAKEPYRTN